MKKIVILSLILYLMAITFTSSEAISKEEKYHIVKVSQNLDHPERYWCITTTAPPDKEVVIKAGNRKNSYEIGTYTLKKVNSTESRVCSNLFDNWENILPLTLVYTQKGNKEISLSGFE